MNLPDIALNWAGDLMVMAFKILAAAVMFRAALELLKGGLHSFRRRPRQRTYRRR
ncbi:hypothetical protein [Enterobacter soli]|uniref:hypothetical protein n=1 Tax=Enterobacter soli TaxID=885040 RepID=UPI002F406D4D